MSAKTIEKEFVLSDSTVNCYGFRLLTSGYQKPEYERNPIGYYMHQRENGVLLRWERINVKGDKITAYPTINLNHPRGEQTVNEVNDGFLNAASVGHIVVLDWSDDPKMKLEGQTGPTITKWYNRECSLVDVPGNNNALGLMYDGDGNAITLASLMKPAASTKPKAAPMAMPQPPAKKDSQEIPKELLYTKEQLYGKDGMAKSLMASNITLYAAVYARIFNLRIGEVKQQFPAIDVDKCQQYMQMAASYVDTNNLLQAGSYKSNQALPKELFYKPEQVFGKNAVDGLAGTLKATNVTVYAVLYARKYGVDLRRAKQIFPNLNNELFDKYLKHLSDSEYEGKVPVRPTGSIDEEIEYPEALFYSFDQLFKEGHAEKLKAKNFTAYAAILWWHYDIEAESILENGERDKVKRDEKNIREGRVIEPDLYKAYCKEMCRRRSEELVKMGWQKLEELDLLNELKEIDKEAYDKMWKEEADRRIAEGTFWTGGKKS